MSLKVNTSAPSSPFELLRDLGDRVYEKDTDFSEELFNQQKEGVSHKEMEAMLKKIDEQAGKLSKVEQNSDV